MTMKFSEDTSKSEETFKGAGGLNIFVRTWRPAGKARGVVVIVPGFNSHSAYYASVAGQFAGIGLAVYALDLRGRGKSDGERFYVEKFGDYVSDVAGVMKLVLNDVDREVVLADIEGWINARLPAA